jgi:hypothetical protein
MPDSSEIAIATAVSHRQPNRFLTLFPLVILDSALTFLFILKCRTRGWRHRPLNNGRAIDQTIVFGPVFE